MNTTDLASLATYAQERADDPELSDRIRQLWWNIANEIGDYLQRPEPPAPGLFDD